MSPEDEIYEVYYWPWNIFETGLKIYLFSDVPYPLKTTRNCLKNLFWNKLTRNMHVSLNFLNFKLFFCDELLLYDKEVFGTKICIEARIWMNLFPDQVMTSGPFICKAHIWAMIIASSMVGSPSKHPPPPFLLHLPAKNLSSP